MRDAITAYEAAELPEELKSWKTIESYRAMLDVVAEAIGDVPIPQLDADVFGLLIGARSEGSRHAFVTSLRAFLNWCGRYAWPRSPQSQPSLRRGPPGPGGECRRSTLSSSARDWSRLSATQCSGTPVKPRVTPRVC